MGKAEIFYIGIPKEGKEPFICMVLYEEQFTRMSRRVIMNPGLGEKVQALAGILSIKAT